jgi:hypothetical protein
MTTAQTFERLTIAVQSETVHHDHTHVADRARRASDRWDLSSHSFAPMLQAGARLVSQYPAMAKGVRE